MFVEKGFTETSMRDLAQSLNVKAASLYNHFKSKEEILDVILDDVSKRFRIMRIELDSAEMDPKDKFEEFLRRYLTEVLKDNYAFELYLSYWNFCDNFVEIYNKGRMEYLEFVQRIFYAINVKSNSKEFKPEAPVMMILTALNNSPQLLLNRENPNIEVVVEELVLRLTKGLYSRFN